MNFIKNILLSPGLVNLITGVSLIIGAYLFEVIGGFDACHLCILQRWTFGLIALCGLFLIIPNLLNIIRKL